MTTTQIISTLAIAALTISSIYYGNRCDTLAARCKRLERTIADMLIRTPQQKEPHDQQEEDHDRDA